MANERKEERGSRRGALYKKMKHIKKMISFLTVICCLAGSILPVHGAEDDSVPRIVFTNEPREQPDIYVSKTVKSAVAGYDVPEEALEEPFDFTLVLDGKKAGRVKYHLYVDGIEVDKEGNPSVDKEGNPVSPSDPYRTDSDGGFTLKAGQMAVFRSEDIRGLKRGSKYVITEEPKEGYEQEEPVGGLPAEGYVDRNGSAVRFVNACAPQGAPATFQVTKEIPFLAGYEIPDSALPEEGFRFRLSFNKKPYANRAFKIVDSIDQARVLGEGATDEEGIFFLQGGTTAVFTGEDIRAGLDYRAEELDLPQGWWAIGETEQSGATDTNTSVRFRNGFASFAVEKKLEDGSRPEDVEFTFLLTKGTGEVWADACYYVYDTGDNSLVAQEGEDIYLRRTDQQGNFKLKAGQIAVFTGIWPGTYYSVSEIPDNPDYVQKVPGTAEGYADKPVIESVESLPFRNDMITGNKLLKVTKILEYGEGEAPVDKSTKFRFILEKRKAGEGEAEYEPVKSATFSVMPEDVTRETGRDGSFYITEGETAVFKSLAPNETYRVREDLEELESEAAEYHFEKCVLNVTDFGNPAGNKELIVTKDDIGQDAGEAVTGFPEYGLTLHNVLDYTFINGYVPDKVDLGLIKKAWYDKRLLQGAKFRLDRVAADGSEIPMPNPEAEEGQEGTLFTTDQEGRIMIAGLQPGHYRLTEVVAPSGYSLMEKSVEIEVERKGWNLEVKVDGKTYVPGKTEEGDDVHIALGGFSGKDAIYLTLYNDSYNLPHAGGIGIYWYMIGGILLMMAAALVLYKYKFAGEVQRD